MVPKEQPYLIRFSKHFAKISKNMYTSGFFDRYKLVKHKGENKMVDDPKNAKLDKITIMNLKVHLKLLENEKMLYEDSNVQIPELGIVEEEEEDLSSDDDKSPLKLSNGISEPKKKKALKEE
jgi:hypothetical protein